MRKLTILKTLVDVLWIFSMISIPIIVFLFGFIFYSNDLGVFNIQINGLKINETTLLTKVILAVNLVTYLILIYCLYLFKKALRYFQRLKMFDNLVINNFKIIGVLLIISSILIGGSSLVYNLKYQQKLSLDIGFSPFMFLVSLGLFFMVLSQIFKISKTMKEENELTI
jgi:hypothetical protein